MSSSFPSLDFISLLRCPTTGQRLSLLEAENLRRLISTASHPIEAALVSEDGCIAYPVRGGIPALLPSEAVCMHVPD